MAGAGGPGGVGMVCFYRYVYDTDSPEHLAAAAILVEDISNWHVWTYQYKYTVYTHIHIYVRTYMHTYTCRTYTYIHTCIHTHTYIDIHTRAYVCAYVGVSVDIPDRKVITMGLRLLISSLLIRV